MGLFNNKHNSRRESGEFRWPFKPVDSTIPPNSSLPRQHPQDPKRKRNTLKISNPVPLEPSIQYPSDIPLSAPPERPQPSAFDFGFTVPEPSERQPDFEPLFRASYVSPVDERYPLDLSAAHAARFHEYLQDLSSADPSATNSLYEYTHTYTKDDDDEVEIYDIYTNQIATAVSLNSPGKPRIIELRPPSSFGSSRSAASSSSDVRTSGFLRSRGGSQTSKWGSETSKWSNEDKCDTPYTPGSFFDSSEGSTPDEQMEKQLGEAAGLAGSYDGPSPLHSTRPSPRVRTGTWGGRPSPRSLGKPWI